MSAVPAALPPTGTASLPTSAVRPARRRIPLAVKLGAALIGLVTIVLLVNGAVNLWLNYEEAKRTAVQVQQEKAQAAAERVDGFISDVENQIGWTTRAEWRRVPLEQQRYDFIRLLRQAPAVTEVSYLDPTGKEQLKVSRLEPDTVGSAKDFSAEPRFRQAVADRVWFGPVYFRRGSEPYMTVSVAHAGRNPGVTTAEVNLKLVWDVITGIKVGEKGYAFVVTSAGRLIAHPDLSLVLRDTDLSRLPQVARALPTAGARAAAKPAPAAEASSEIGTDLAGNPVLSAHAPIGRVGWLVFVQSPVSEALAPVYRSLTRAGLLLAIGLGLATLVGSLLARRMTVPIRRLQEGAERLGGGDLSERIAVRTGDEIETLADRFNQMAGRIQESYATLEGKVVERTRDLNESLQQQTATADVLKVISRSVFDLQPVLDTLIQSAARLCAADNAFLFQRDGDLYGLAANHGFSAEYAQFMRDNPIPAGRGTLVGRTALLGQIVHLPDVLADPEYAWRESQRIGGFRTMLGVPLLREGVPIGVIALTRTEVRPFSDKQVDLVATFADQAVIAIENARLFEEVQARTRELSESLQQQTATADVLKVISRSAFDLQTVLDTLVASASRLCGAERGVIFLGQDDQYRIVSVWGFATEIIAYSRDNPLRPGMDSTTGRVALEGRTIHSHDVLADPNYKASGYQKIGGYRTSLGVPLLREGTTIGVFVLTRPIVQPFSERQIDIVTTFADQAVIAIENARLFEEVQARTREVQQSLEYQTATSEVLGVISRSPRDLQPVLDAIVAIAARICEAKIGDIALIEGDHLRVAATMGEMARPVGHIPLERGTVMGRSILDGQPVHVHDLLHAGDEFPAGQKLAVQYGHRTILCVPLLKGSQAIGTIVLRRDVVQPFSDKQIALLKTFADQAVIAINNVGLFEEVQARTRELQESLQYQTATGDVLGVISRSPNDLQPVLDAISATAHQLCEAGFTLIFMRRPDGLFHLASSQNAEGDFLAWLIANPIAEGDGTASGRAAREKSVVHFQDAQNDPRFSDHRRLQRSKARTQLAVPLMRGEAVIGVIFLARTVVEPFAERQVQLVTTFADQAVIAINNVGLFEEVQARTAELQLSLDDLRKAQDRLVQSEKLASLGQLTAGIAHEIKNPLNFVNNFSSLSGDLIDELREVLEPAALDDKVREEVDELTAMLKGNLEKVVQHGKRADSIVKNMLLHSREGSGEHRPVDLNALVEESMNLAYHGARAEKPGFNVTLRKEFDPAAGEVDLYPQEITRVLLNLIGNGFYAATKRKSEMDGSFEPTLSAATRNLGEEVEIRIRDNGTGIPDEVKAKMFNPFFTTKPAGEGTGLGLSLSHDIIVKQHGGSIEVATQPGAFTEFTITLPRAGAATAKVSVPGGAS